MPGYIKSAIHKYQHAAPTRPEYAPHAWNPHVYSAEIQYVEKKKNPAFSTKDVNKLQQLTGTLLYYSRDVDQTLIIPINVLASEHSKATADTADKVTRIRYHASDMILYIQSDASYLSDRGAKSKAGGLLLHV
jgi:hypothetical protein